MPTDAATTYCNNRLRDHAWSVGYSSDKVDLIRSFYQPAMSLAIRYDRSVGYFSSVSLAIISRGIRALYLRNGTIRLIASPVLSPNDIEAIRQGHLKSDTMIENRLLEFLDHRRLDEDQSLQLQLLSGMLADGLLELQLAVREHADGSLELHHEKMGIFEDTTGDYITFIGSPNESWNGWVGNAESFGLNTSWGPTHEHAEHWRNLFGETWNRNRSGVVMRDFPTVVRDELFKRFPPREPTPSGGTRKKRSLINSDLELPQWLRGDGGLREYQRDAVNAWLEAKGRGIFAMATGTGKTITALAAATQLWKAISRDNRSLLVLVIVPSKDLVRQWSSVAAEFGFCAVECHSGTGIVWRSRVQSVLQRLEYAAPAVEMIVSTADTFVTSLGHEVRIYVGATLIIADEMHSLGTERRLGALPDAKYRLGLSATPQRHGDEEGTESLVKFFGDVLQSIDIRRAIELKALVPYDYHPVIVRMSREELEKYKEYSAKIAAAIGGCCGSEDAFAGAEYWLIQRARLLGQAEAKIEALRELMRTRADSCFNLVYVAEGTHPISDRRQIENVKQLLGSELKMKVQTYTGETSMLKRAELQLMLREKELQALIAMKCLDEGIDIPEARTGIILASTQNPRQFVQRRGRILRRHDEGGKTFAELYDFLVLPESPPEKSDPAFALERRLVGRELTRSLELASASRNGRDVPPPGLRKAMEAYELLELLADYHQPISWSSGGRNVY
jgi:superfamily II DNA or RNA helicase